MCAVRRRLANSPKRPGRVKVMQLSDAFPRQPTKRPSSRLVLFSPATAFGLFKRPALGDDILNAKIDSPVADT